MKPETLGGRKAFTVALAAGVSTLALGACVPAVVPDRVGAYETCDTSPDCGDNISVEIVE